MRARSSADRSRARRLRKKLDDGGELGAKDKRWLEAYERDTTRWRGTEADQGAAAAEPEPSAGGVKPPVHFSEDVNADASRWTAEPHLPPRPSEPDPAELGGADPAAAAAPVDPTAPTPLIDNPQKPLDEAALHAGAERFAGMVASFNAFGLAALVELVPPGSLPLPASLEATVRDPANHQMVVEFIAANAYQVAIDHPWLCAVTPSPSVVVLGASSISAAAIFARHIRPMLTGEKLEPVEVGPDAAKPSNGHSGGNTIPFVGVRRAPSSPPTEAAPAAAPKPAKGFDVEDLGFPS